jgi:hypothetical protein
MPFPLTASEVDKREDDQGKSRENYRHLLVSPPNSTDLCQMCMGVQMDCGGHIEFLIGSWGGAPVPTHSIRGRGLPRRPPVGESFHRNPGRHPVDDIRPIKVPYPYPRSGQMLRASM